jgi:hypothetical protein
MEGAAQADRAQLEPSMEIAMPEKLLTTEQAAEYLSVSKAYLHRDRFIANQSGTPPVIPFLKISPKIVRYRLSDLEALAAG